MIQNRQQSELEFLANYETGFRLTRLEILNWGTFKEKIWTIEPGGYNSLLTGDIGSGKSTLIDALTSLLVPHNKIVFNKAAGSEKKERSLYSYLRGEYKSEKDEERNISKSIYLRDQNNYSVLLGVFYNAGFEQVVTIAQVFWLKDDKIDKLFLVSTRALDIQTFFTAFGNDISLLRKKLLGEPGIELYKNFSDYSSKFRSLFGIRSEKALDLFYQTVSLKQVGNLTDFIRNQMLEKTDVKELIDDLIRNFENLTRAHDAVLKAKRQLDKLTPIHEKAEEFERSKEKWLGYTQSRQAIPAFISWHKEQLLTKALKDLAHLLEILGNQIFELDSELERLREEEIQIRSSLDNNREGQRIREIENLIARLEDSKETKLKKHTEYLVLVKALGFTPPANENDFYKLLERARAEQEKTNDELEQLSLKRDSFIIKKDALHKERETLSFEINSLKLRKTQIPKKNLDLRARMLQDLELTEAELPFVGELLRVKAGCREWEGACERLLHSFGLSLIVPEALYKRVSHYVNLTDLKGKLVYFKVDEAVQGGSTPEMTGDMVVNKLEIKGDSPYYYWLKEELAHKFNLICCETMDDFHHHPYAITKQGQIKSGKIRHEKDDRIAISDKRYYILGWDNLEKIELLEKELEKLSRSYQELTRQIAKIDQEKIRNQHRIRDFDFFIKIDNYAGIFWQKEAGEIEKLNGEKKELEKSSNVLKALNEQLTLAKRKQEEQSRLRNSKYKEQSLADNQQKIYEGELQEARLFKDSLTEEERNKNFPVIEKFVDNGMKITLENINKVQVSIIDKLDDKITSYNSTLKLHSNKLLNLMNEYKREFPEETLEIELSEEAIPEFKQMLKKIKDDDLPRYEKRFNDLLKEKTIQDIALFNQRLDIFACEITEKIGNINKSLKDIEYNPGSYIMLIIDKTTDVDVRDFQWELKKCLEATFNESEMYSEEKFKQVKKLLDRFNTDFNWMSKVTDVRNWFIFTASERWSEDDSEKEYYSSSSGKSGGQKEKLAYTILASALAYQFGLEWNTIKSRSFRFVVIDEAFGRGSDESTRYGLELFKKLDLQLLIVTPLQKINIIENYIKTIHYVVNKEGNNSRVMDIDIREYRENKHKLQRLESKITTL
jgi:uncharacterized protein YPO0396